MSAAPLLSVRDLRVGFATEGGRVQAVDGVSFELAPGEVLAIVGESGSGKSVTAQTIIGLTRSPNARIEGSVRLDEHRADRRRARASCAGSAASAIGMVFQDPMTSFNPVYRVGAPDRRGDPRPPRGRQAARRASGRSSCSTRSAFPTPRGASTTTRTSSPAGCASGR